MQFGGVAPPVWLDGKPPPSGGGPPQLGGGHHHLVGGHHQEGAEPYTSYIYRVVTK